MTFYIKQDDTSPSLKQRLLDANGSSRNITGYNRVDFHMRDCDRNLVVDASTSTGNTITVLDAANGEVQYDWQTSDTEKIGEYEAEWEVEFGDGSVETFPNNGFVDIEIVEDIK